MTEHPFSPQHRSDKVQQIYDQVVGTDLEPEVIYRASRRIIDDLEATKTHHQAEIERLQYEATHDALTGLPNKNALKEKLDAAIASDEPVAVTFIDLTNFKRLNDEHPGRHGTGDMILTDVSRGIQEVADEFNQSIRHEGDTGDMIAHEQYFISPEPIGTDTVIPSRFGGDEFIVMTKLEPRTAEYEHVPPEQLAAIVEDRLRTKLNTVTANHPDLADYGFDVAIGSAVWDHKMTPSELLHAADVAMFEDKAQQHHNRGKYR